MDSRIVEDHEEFLELVQDSETGVYVMEMWQLHSNRRDKPVSSINVARKAFTALYEREGWDTRLLTGLPLGVTFRDGVDGSREGGFWWSAAPVDYWEHFDVPESHLFIVRSGTLDIALWPFEYTMRQRPEKAPTIPLFEQQCEMALVNRTLYVYDTGNIFAGQDWRK